jgi:hypothetical protein
VVKGRNTDFQQDVFFFTDSPHKRVLKLHLFGTVVASGASSAFVDISRRK